MKTILFVTDGYPPTVSGSSMVLGILAPQLSARGHRVHVFLVNGHGSGGPDAEGPVQVWGRAQGAAPGAAPCAPRPNPLREWMFNRLVVTPPGLLYIEHKYTRRDLDAFRAVLQHVAPDVVISVNCPLRAHLLAAQERACYRWLCYNTDPFYNNRHYTPPRGPLLRQELALFAAADGVILPDYMWRDYTVPAFNAVRHRFLMANLPLVSPAYTPPAAPPTAGAGGAGAIHCVYTGTISRGVRDPRPLLRLFARLGGGFRLTCAGAIEGFGPTATETFTRLAGGRAAFPGQLPPAQAAALAAGADILINLGNWAENQVPSKVYSYINTGKPIVSVRVAKHCASAHALRNYGNALIIDAQELATPAGTQRFAGFCRSHAGRTEDRQALLAAYREYTPAFVTNLFEAAIDPAAPHDGTNIPQEEEQPSL